MSKRKFDYQAAIEEGHSDEDIMEFLSSEYPDFDIQTAIEEGYQPSDINEYLSTYKPERSALQKAGRIGAQVALGAAEAAVLPYEIASASLSSPEAQGVVYRQNVMDDIEQLSMKKMTGQWTPEDQQLFEHLQEQIKNPEKAQEFVQTMDVGVRDLAEKATGIDFEPEGLLEKGANFLGFIKDPSKIVKAGLKPKQLIKAIMPSGEEALRSLGVGTALEMAEDGNFGPIGTMAAMAIGDLGGMGVNKAAKEGSAFLKDPKKYLAEAAASFTNKEKRDLQKDIIKQFRESGIQADLGTITDSNLVRWTQSRLAQSGLTGKALDEFKETLLNEIKSEYAGLANSIGEAQSATRYQLGESLQNTLKDVRDKDLKEIRSFYENSIESLPDRASASMSAADKTIKKLEKKLKPGQLKSKEQKLVLEALEPIKRDMYDSEGNLLRASVKDMHNNKLALQDLINYEAQGGAKKLLKELVADIDRGIISYGKENPSFGKNYLKGQKQMSAHAKTFRNKEMSKLLNQQNPEKILDQMNSVHGIKSFEKILNKTPEGRDFFKDIKRAKFDELMSSSLVNSVEDQMKMGKFNNLLKTGKQKALAKELLGPTNYLRFERLQKNATTLQKSMEKFYNASKSGVVAADAAIILTGLKDLGALLSGNPWPLFKMGASLGGAKKLSKLMSDPDFLKTVEDVILSTKKGSEKDFLTQIDKLLPYLKVIYPQASEQ